MLKPKSFRLRNQGPTPLLPPSPVVLGQPVHRLFVLLDLAVEVDLEAIHNTSPQNALRGEKAYDLRMYTKTFVKRLVSLPVLLRRRAAQFPHDPEGQLGGRCLQGVRRERKLEDRKRT